MSRQKRELSSTNTYHVMIRGNERKNIFIDDDDKRKFLDITYERNKENNFEIYAYCLMSNHVHLIIKEINENISIIMKRINTSYVYYFNKKYRRVGHLFQDRFKSETIENDKYLLSVIRYVHNNPVQAKMSVKPEEYRWSSYRGYLYEKDYSNRYFERKTILNIISSTKDKAINELIRFTNEDNYDKFIEHIEKGMSKKITYDDTEIRVLINEYLRAEKLTLSDLKSKNNIRNRHELITRIRENSDISIRKIAEILEIGKKMVERAIG